MPVSWETTSVSAGEELKGFYMANPQKEQGHTQISNEFLEAFFRFQMPDYPRRVFGMIMRKTWGWNKKADFIPLSQLSELTGIKRAHICRSLLWLKAANMITRQEDGMTQIRKDYDEWVVPTGGLEVVPVQGVPIQGLGGVVPNEVMASPHIGNEVVPVQGHSKDISSKDTSQKTVTPLPPSGECAVPFQFFWDVYPRHVSRKKAEQTWHKLKPTPELASKIIRSVQRMKKHPQWVRQGGQFIPHPTTYLNQARWEDEISPEAMSLVISVEDLPPQD